MYFYKTLLVLTTLIFTNISLAHPMDEPVSLISVNGPAGVYSGECSKQIKIQLQDLNGNYLKARMNTTLQIKGLRRTKIYTNSSCSGQGQAHMITFTPGTDTRVIYFKSNFNGTLNLKFSDLSDILFERKYSILVSN